MLSISGFGQVVTECPKNIGFEDGTFNNWECYIGEISGTGGMFANAPRPATVNLQYSPPVVGQHTVIKRSNDVDYYGEFSLNAPNGSDYIVQLGNDQINRGAERISYTINVPKNVESYSIIFNYAVVFQNPGHEHDEQPKFTARVFDVMSNSSTECGSFEFVASGELPDFKTSKFSGRYSRSGGALDVLYKTWSPVLVNLSDYRGRTIRLEFTTNDCSRGGHFGYAYIDFNENCSIPVTGNITCPDADKITLKTLPGFFGYKWYNTETSEVYGTRDSVVLSPVPPIGTKIGVELVPYQGLGCTQTLYTVIQGMEMTIREPLPDCISVDLTDISLRVGNSSDISYSYWKNSAATTRIDNPRRITVSGVYYVMGRSSSGCVKIVPVKVTIASPPIPLAFIQALRTIYPGTIDLTQVFIRRPTETYSYWMDKETKVPIPDPTRIGKQGVYYILSATAANCTLITSVTIDILIPDLVIPNTFTPNNDGVNDELTVLLNSNVQVKYFKIFNRWGEVVYTTTDINHYWTGFKETTQVPVGVYYWAIEGVLYSKKYYRSGYVTVIR